MVKRLVGKGRPRSTRYYRWWWWYLQKKRKGRGGPSDIPIWDELPNLDELIFASSGDVSEDGAWLYGGPGNHCPNGQMKGSAFKGNGTNYGVLTYTATLVGDFTLRFSFKHVVTGVNQSPMGESSSNRVTINDSNAKVVVIGGDVSAIGLPAAVDGMVYNVELKRVGTALTWTDSSGSDTETTTLDDFLISYVCGRGVAQDELSGDLWDVYAEDSTGVKLDLPMICLGSGTEFSSTTGLPDCVWNPPVAVQLPSHPGVPTQHEVDPGAFYEVFTDGTGSNRANEDGFTISYNEILYSSDITNAVWVKDIGITAVDSDTLVMSDDPNDSLSQLVNKTYDVDMEFGCTIQGPSGKLVRVYLSGPNIYTSILLDGSEQTASTILPAGSTLVRFQIRNDWGNAESFTVNIKDFFGIPVGYTGQIATTQGSRVSGVVPAAYPDVETQCLGPIAADMLLGGIGIQGDDNRYVVTDAPSDPSAIDTITVSYIHGPTPAYTRFIVGAKAASDRFYIGVDDLNLVRIALGDTTITGTVDNIELVQGEHYLISLWAKDGSYSLTVNGVEDSSGTYLGQAGTRLYGLSLMSLQNSANNSAPTQGVVLSVETRLNGNLVNHWHCEDGQPGQAVAKVEDVKGYNHGTIIEPVAAQLPSTPENPYPIQRALETAWVQTTVGPCYRMAGGFNLDKEGPELWVNPVLSKMTDNGDGSYTVIDGGPGDLTVWDMFIPNTVLYVATFTVSNYTSGLAWISSMTTAGGYWPNAAGDYTLYFYNNGSVDGVMRFYAEAAGTVLSNMSVKQVILGYSCEDMNNPGYDVDGDPIQWKVGQYEKTFLNAGILVQGSLGPETQALTTWKDGAWVDISTLPFNVDDQEFYCDKGLSLYNTPQDAESIDDIGSVICSSYVPDYNLVKNGEFYNDLSRWTPTQWEWQEPGRAAPVHTTSNTLKQTIDMEAGDNITVSFQYHLEAGATLYVKLGNPSGINDIVIAGPADGTHTSIETATGDTIQFAITGAATLDDWIDNVRIEKSDGNIMTDQ